MTQSARIASRKRLFAASVAIASLAACTDPTPKTRASSDPAGDEVVMQLIAYRPDHLEVMSGTAVTWIQRDAGSHTVTSGTASPGAGGSVETKPDGTFSSDRLPKGERFSHTFDEEGTYEYFCEIHPATMTGTVEVRNNE